MNREKLKALEVKIRSNIRLEHTPMGKELKSMLLTFIDAVTEQTNRNAFENPIHLEQVPLKIVEAPKKYNLLYHITPIGNYKWNIEKLLQYWNVFDYGRKAIAIATGKDFDAPEKVIDLFPSQNNTQFFTVDNHPELRETHSFPSLLLKASEWTVDSSTFYAHTKGVTRKDDPAITLWTEILYYYNLHNIELVQKSLDQFPITGCCKRHGKFSNFPKESTYHYSGTFFWFRNKDLFERKWIQVPPMRYGTEAYLSLLFKEREAGCLWGNKFHNGYDWNYMKTLVQNEPHFQTFLRLHKDYIPPAKGFKAVKNNPKQVISG